MATIQTELLKEPNYGHWISFRDFNPSEYFGFLYLIINNINNKKYIGKKNFKYSNGKKNNWEKYISSSEFLKKDIKLLDKDNFTFLITELCKEKAELDRREIEEQTLYNVLTAILPNGEKEFYNRHIPTVGFNTTGIIGENSPHIDPLIYNFKNIDGKYFTGTQYQFKQYSKLSDTQVSTLIYKNCQNSKGWFLIDDNDQRIVPFSDNIGKNNYRYDNTVYTIKHRDTGEIFSGCRKDIEIKTGAAQPFVANFVIGKKKSIYGWFIIDENNQIKYPVTLKGIVGKNYLNNKIYKFKHKITDEILIGTKRDLISRGINEESVRRLINGKGKTALGWILIKE